MTHIALGTIGNPAVSDSRVRPSPSAPVESRFHTDRSENQVESRMHECPEQHEAKEVQEGHGEEETHNGGGAGIEAAGIIVIALGVAVDLGLLGGSGRGLGKRER